MSEDNKIKAAFIVGAGIGFAVGLNLIDFIDWISNKKQMHTLSISGCNKTHELAASAAIASLNLKPLEDFKQREYIPRPDWSYESDPESDEGPAVGDKEPLYSTIISDKLPSDYIPELFQAIEKKKGGYNEIKECNEQSVIPIISFALHPEQYKPSGSMNYSVWPPRPTLEINDDYNPNVDIN